MKKSIKEKGKYVSRAVYAKLQAEKNRLYNDIRVMVDDRSGKGIQTWLKWERHFKKEQQLHNMLREIAKEELPKLQAKIDSNPKAFK